MTNAAKLYEAAVSNYGRDGSRHGVATVVLATGTEIFCCIDRVAGRSVIKGHHRTTWRMRAPGEQYSKPISRKVATGLLK